MNAYVCMYTCVCIYECTQHLCLCTVNRYVYKSMCVYVYVSKLNLMFTIY